MRKACIFIALLALVGFCVACNSSGTKKVNGQRYAKKIYLTKEDYMEDLKNVAELDRRDLQPNKESEYIFNVIPPTDLDNRVYFYDKRQNPKIPGTYTDQEYKQEKRLWKKPRRFTPEEYYGLQGGGGAEGGTGSETTAYYE